MPHPDITHRLAAAELRERIGMAERLRRRRIAALRTAAPLPSTITYRRLDASDAAELRALATLDGRPTPSGVVVAAVRGGRIVAAAGSDGLTVADPFVPTGGAVAALHALLEAEARAARTAPGGRWPGGAVCTSA